MSKVVQAEFMKTRRDPESFGWSDICDVYGEPYEVGDWFTIDSPIPMGGPMLLVHIDLPAGAAEFDEDAREGNYYYIDPAEPDVAGGWTHYKLRELTIKSSKPRATPEDVSDYLLDLDSDELEWVAEANDRLEALTSPHGDWL